MYPQSPHRPPTYPWPPTASRRPSPGLPRDTHTLQLRLPMAFLGPQEAQFSEPHSPSPDTRSSSSSRTSFSEARGAPAPDPASSKGPALRSSRLWETPRQAAMSQRVGAVSALHLGVSRWGMNPGQGGPEKASWTKGPHSRVT